LGWCVCCGGGGLKFEVQCRRRPQGGRFVDGCTGAGAWPGVMTVEACVHACVPAAGQMGMAVE
jgi:hypothetical protein